MHAFALMGNHYHLLIETPEANLVDGMRWLQGTYTKRFNARHRQWGHLLQSRYKALVVDPNGDYFSTVASYIHLNPARAKCFDLEEGGLLDYAWSSYPLYMKPSKRPEWLDVDRALGNLGLSDRRVGRNFAFACRRELVKKHDEREARRLLDERLAKLKLEATDLPALKKGDDRKKVVAWVIRKNTSVKNEWIVQHLHMGRASNLSRYVKEVDEAQEGSLWELR